MKLFQLFRVFIVDPVNLSIKAKLLSLIACFCSIFFIALITKIISPWPGYPMIVASMGASSIILFFIPGSPLAQPWPFAGGQLISALVGIACALNISETATAAATAVGASVVLMLIFRCLHPPAAATSLTPIMAGSSITSLGYSFVLVPVALNVATLLVLAIIINRWIMHRDYPSPIPAKKLQTGNAARKTNYHIGFLEEDLSLALTHSNVFLDMTHAELCHLLTQAEMNAFKRIKRDISCADIMLKEVTYVEYGTEVEKAWEIMHQNKLKAMPVLDKARRVIGIITWSDFFKFVDLNSYADLQNNFRRFIRRTPANITSKPEAVGHIMTTSVVTLPETLHIIELISLMSTQGYKQIPIVNQERKFVGMVFQADLIAGLYNDQLIKKLDPLRVSTIN